MVILGALAGYAVIVAMIPVLRSRRERVWRGDRPSPARGPAESVHRYRAAGMSMSAQILPRSLSAALRASSRSSHWLTFPKAGQSDPGELKQQMEAISL